MIGADVSTATSPGGESMWVNHRHYKLLACAILIVAILTAVSATVKAGPQVSEEQARSIFEERCSTCHNGQLRPSFDEIVDIVKKWATEYDSIDEAVKSEYSGYDSFKSLLDSMASFAPSISSEEIETLYNYFLSVFESGKATQSPTTTTTTTPAPSTSPTETTVGETTGGQLKVTTVTETLTATTTLTKTVTKTEVKVYTVTETTTEVSVNTVTIGGAAEEATSRLSSLTALVTNLTVVAVAILILVYIYVFLKRHT